MEREGEGGERERGRERERERDTSTVYSVFSNQIAVFLIKLHHLLSIYLS